MSASRSPRTVVASLLAIVTLLGTSLLSVSPAYAATRTVSGTVTVEQSPGVFVPATDFSVYFWSLRGDGTYYNDTFTGSSTGTWSMDVKPGNYRVRFEAGGYFVPDEIAVNYDVWLGGTPHEFDGQVLTVGGSNVTGVDGQLPLGSTISGVLMPDSGADATAYLWDETANRYIQHGESVTSAYGTGQYTLSGLPPGDYIIRYSFASIERDVQYWEGESYWQDSTRVTVGFNEHLTGYDFTLGDSPIYSGRLSGPNRFATAAEISGFFEPGSPAFIVNGLNFPDALSAGPAAALEGGPILLVTPTSIPSETAARLESLNPSTIYVIGGPPSVSNSVKSQLAAYTDGEVVRISGADRYATSRAVARYFFTGEDVYTAYFATGVNFPDALGAGPAAANEFGPVILHYGLANEVDAETAALIAELDINRIVIAGSPAVVTTSLANSLYALPSIEQLNQRNGSDRFDTAVRIANADNVDGGSFEFADTVFLATGLGFPDALAGTAVAGALGSPIYLVQSNCIPEKVINDILRLRAKEVVLLGGPPVLGSGVENFVQC